MKILGQSKPMQPIITIKNLLTEDSKYPSYVIVNSARLSQLNILGGKKIKWQL